MSKRFDMKISQLVAIAQTALALGAAPLINSTVPSPPAGPMPERRPGVRSRTGHRRVPSWLGREHGRRDAQPVLIRAGPGTGKTWCVLQLAFFLARGARCSTRRRNSHPCQATSLPST